MIDLKSLTIALARKKLDSKEFSAVELASAYLEEIKKKNAELNAYLEVYDDVLEQAKRADDRIKKGESHPMLGIPVAVKDNILIEGKHISSASKMLQNYISSYDATVIRKLKKQGAIFLGRTNMDEFALGGSTENSAFGGRLNLASSIIFLAGSTPYSSLHLGASSFAYTPGPHPISNILIKSPLPSISRTILFLSENMKDRTSFDFLYLES